MATPDELAAEAIEAIQCHQETLALAKLDQLAAESPEHPVLSRTRAYLSMHRGQYREALSEARQAVQRDPSDELAWRVLAQSAWRQDQFNLTQHAFEQLLKLNGRKGEPLAMYAVFMAEQRSPKVAEAIAREVLAADPSSAMGTAALGLCLYRRRDLIEAERTFKGGLATHPDHPLLRSYMLGLLQETNRDAKAAALGTLMHDDPLTADFAGEQQKAIRTRQNMQRVLQRGDVQQEILSKQPRSTPRFIWWIAVAVIGAVVLMLIVAPPSNPIRFGMPAIVLAGILARVWLTRD